MDTQAAGAKAKYLADIATKKKLQKQYLQISPTGEIKLHCERFGDDLIGLLDMKISERPIIIRNGVDEVLSFTMEDKGGGHKWILWKINEGNLNKKFQKAGIHLGYKGKMEKDIRELLFVFLMDMAKTVTLPVRHGWVVGENGILRFAFPDEITWEEIEKYAY